MEPVKPAVTLLKEVGEAGQHDDVTEDIGVRVITVAEGHDKSQPSGCLLEMENEILKKATVLLMSDSLNSSR